MKKYSSHTRLVEGRAEVQIGNRSFTIARRERTILFHVARLCEVHKMLAGESTFDYRLKTASLDEHFV